MSPPFPWRTTSSILNLSTYYQALLIDVWGVIYDGAAAYKGVIETINQLIQQGKPIIFISNSPRPNKILSKTLMELGLHVQLDQILTSGDVVREYLVQRKTFLQSIGKRLYHLGAERNQDILANLDTQYEVVDSIENADFILLTVFMDDDEDLKQYQEILQRAKLLNLPIVCANPDKAVMNIDRVRYCSGFVAEQYENIDGLVHYCGKPHAPIFEVALEKLARTGITDKQSVVMIGDSLETDILGANEIGIDSALVLTGNMGRLLKTHTLSKIISDQGIIPTWVVGEVVC